MGASNLRETLSPWRRRVLWLGAAILVSLLASTWLASRADAYVFWVTDGGSIGSANPDGSNVQAITGPADNPIGVSPGAVGTDGTYIYFATSDANNGTPEIGRVRPDGSGLTADFITLQQVSCPGGVSSFPQADAIAVSGSYIYWADSLDNTIGRASLSSPKSTVNEDFITGSGGLCPGAQGPLGVAADSSHVYWSNPGADTVGQAKLDGTSPNNSFITGANHPTGVALSGANLYWVNAHTGGAGDVNAYVGHAQLSSTGAVVGSPSQQFLGPFPSYGDQTALGADGSYVYFDNGDKWIGRAPLDGKSVTPHLVQTSVANFVPTIAVDGGRANPTTTSVSCSPSAVQVLDPQPSDPFYGTVLNTTNCTAVVRDTGGGSASHPAGSVGALSDSPTEGSIQTTDGTCTLSPASSAGVSSCSFQFQTDDTVDGFVPHQTSTTISAAYSGETTHEASGGQGSLLLEIVHACHRQFGEAGYYYLDVCHTAGPFISSGGGGGSGGGGAGPCHVPNVVGKKLSAAKSALTSAHCSLGTVKKKHASKRKKGQVLSESPSAGSTRPANTKINLVVGK